MYFLMGPDFIYEIVAMALHNLPRVLYSVRASFVICVQIAMPPSIVTQLLDSAKRSAK